jgi:hypothetical protein
MAYGVGFIFDQQTDARIRDVWHRLHDRGFVTPLALHGSLPHISLVLSEELCVDEAIGEIEEAVRTQPRLEIRFSTVGVFTRPEPVLFYGITPTEVLMRWHANLERVYRRHCPAVMAASQPGVWVPHCSLTGRVEGSRLQDGFTVAAETPLPFAANHLRLAMVQFDRSGVEMLKVIPMDG